MQFFVSRAVGAIFALLVAASTVSALPQPTGVVAKDVIATLKHEENPMLKRQTNTILNHDENDMLKRQENTMLKRERQENISLDLSGVRPSALGVQAV